MTTTTPTSETITERLPLPPFTFETTSRKVRAREDLWNTSDPEKAAGGYSLDSRWRNRSEFVNGKNEIVALLKRKWSKELDYRLIKVFWALTGNRIAVRLACINDLPIREQDRKYRWPLGRRPDNHPGLSDFGSSPA